MEMFMVRLGLETSTGLMILDIVSDQSILARAYKAPFPLAVFRPIAHVETPIRTIEEREPR